jgi:hypothetical protein
VTRIDGTGTNALALMKSEGAEFLVRGVWIKYLIENLEANGVGRKSQNRLSAFNGKSLQREERTK